MAEVKKARLFLRRGTDTDRKTTTLCEGELGYSTDAFRVVVGDGTTAGGRATGAVLHVSGGTTAATSGANFFTKLTEASAFPGRGGLALSGDFAAFQNAGYTNAAGNNVSTGLSGTTVMLLTGSDASLTKSWVAVNSGIPWGNLDVADDDISPLKVHGLSGNTAGEVTMTTNFAAMSSVTLSGIADTADNPDPFVGHKANVYPLGITGTAQVTAVSSVFDFTNSSIDGTGPSFISPVSLSANPTSGSLTGQYNVITTLNLTTLATSIPPNARTVIISVMAERYGGLGSRANDTRAILYVTNSSAGSNLLEASSIKVAGKELASVTNQLFVPIHNDSGTLKIYIKANQAWAQLPNKLSASGSGLGQWSIKAVGYQI